MRGVYPIRCSDDFTERKLFFDGGVDEWGCRALHVIPASTAILRYVIEEPAEVGAQPLMLARGDISIAHHWADRPYNVYHWHHDGHGIIGFALH
jgi:hypothetical protein